MAAAGLMIGLVIVDELDLAGDGSQDRAAEADEDLRWFVGDEASPRAWGRSSVLVDRNQVDRVGRPEGIGAVARHSGWPGCSARGRSLEGGPTRRRARARAGW